MGDHAPAFAVVRCAGDNIPGQRPCGDVELTFDQYEHQMARPHLGWSCPQCGSNASYLDAPSERLQGITTEHDDEDVPR